MYIYVLNYDVDQSDLTLELVPPPTSLLVSKLFPKLKPDPPKSKLPAQVRYFMCLIAYS